MTTQKLTQEQERALNAITDPYRTAWEAGDTSDSKWRGAVAEYCIREGVPYDTAARYLEIPGYRE